MTAIQLAPATGAFYFYDAYDTSPKFSHDPTGELMVGRYTVRFDSEWSQSCEPVRGSANIELIEWRRPQKKALPFSAYLDQKILEKALLGQDLSMP